MDLDYEYYGGSKSVKVSKKASKKVVKKVAKKAVKKVAKKDTTRARSLAAQRGAKTRRGKLIVENCDRNVEELLRYFKALAPEVKKVVKKALSKKVKKSKKAPVKKAPVKKAKKATKRKAKKATKGGALLEGGVSVGGCETCGGSCELCIGGVPVGGVIKTERGRQQQITRLQNEIERLSKSRAKYAVGQLKQKKAQLKKVQAHVIIQNLTGVSAPEAKEALADAKQDGFVGDNAVSEAVAVVANVTHEEAKKAVKKHRADLKSEKEALIKDLSKYNLPRLRKAKICSSAKPKKQRPVSPWIEAVRQVASANNAKYNEVLKNPKLLNEARQLHNQNK